MNFKNSLTGLTISTRNNVFVTCAFFLLEVLVTFGKPLRVALLTLMYVDLAPTDVNVF